MSALDRAFASARHNRVDVRQFAVYPLRPTLEAPVEPRATQALEDLAAARDRHREAKNARDGAFRTWLEERTPEAQAAHDEAKRTHIGAHYDLKAAEAFANMAGASL